MRVKSTREGFIDKGFRLHYISRGGGLGVMIVNIGRKRRLAGGEKEIPDERTEA
jgi:hypothetical protein